MTAAGRPQLFGHDVRRIHCVGVAGMGVGPLAMYLARLGFEVSGEDDAPAGLMRDQLERAGVRLTSLGEDVELVAISSAVPPTHPTVVAANARKLRIVRRGELLAEVVRGRKLVAVCGSHGKTTTTAMLITALRSAGFPAGYVLGGLPADGAAPAAAGLNDWVVAEVDESDGTIEQFAPEITVAVNLDWDHADRYRTRGAIEAAFAGLFSRTRGTVLGCATCRMSQRVLAALPVQEKQPQIRTFGTGGDFARTAVEDTASGMTLRLGGLFAGAEASIRARGDFNADNATAALAAAQLMGADVNRDALANFAGVGRRQAVLQPAAPRVVEDYAHHPAEITALLRSLKPQVAGGRLIVVFQPHRFTRTAQFKAEFAASLVEADRVYLLDVYPAGEGPVAGGSASDLLAEFSRFAPHQRVSQVSNDDALYAALNADVVPADLVAFVGAGDIDKKARLWLSRRSKGDAMRWDRFLSVAKPQMTAATKLTREEPLAGKTTMRVGGAARVYAEPASLDDLQLLLRLARAESIPVFVLGRGSNLIVPDEGVNGLVLSLGHEAWAGFEPREGGRVWAGAGLRLKNLCGLAAKAGLVGFEFLEGIPGSLGGALRMNAGAMGGWMFDVVEEVQLITLAGELKTLAKAAMHVDYRHCAELHDAIALGALLRPASQADASAVRRQMDAYAKKRHESQPREPSAGCIFKNPTGNSAGRLIDESGLKGLRVGDAEVSPVHANFIVNRGRATSADILQLVRLVRSRVREAKGVDLQPEVLLYGKRWEDVL